MGPGVGVDILLGRARREPLAQFSQLPRGEVADRLGRRAGAQFVVRQVNQALHVLPLQVAPQAAHQRIAVGVSLGGVDLANLRPSRFVNRLEHFRQSHRIFVGGDAELVVVHPRQSHRIEQRRHRRRLDSEHFVVHRPGRLVKLVLHVPPFVDREVFEQLRSQAVGFVVEGVLQHKGHGLALGVRRHRHHRCRGVRITLAGPVHVRPAQPVGHHGDRLHLGQQGQLVAPPRLGPGVAVLDKLFEQLGPGGLGQRDLVFRIRQRVLGEVVAPRPRVRPAGVFIRPVDQLRLRGPRQDRLQFLLERIAVFNRPLVVDPHAVHPIVALHAVLARHHVDRNVVHHRTRKGFLALHGFAVDLAVVIDARGLKVVAQPQGVPHFVHHQIR